MGEFFSTHVGFLKFVDGGFQLSMSWGLFFGIFITLFFVCLFRFVSNAAQQYKAGRKAMA